MTVLITGARLVDAGTVTPDSWALFEGDRVAARGAGAPPAGIRPAESVDAGGRWLTPGFVDMHVHGGGGADLGEGPEAAALALELHRAHGTTRSVVSLVTASVPDLAAQLRALAPLVRRDPLVLGTHLEGPFLSAERSGAHTPALLRAPDAAAVAALLEAADGTLAQVTLAPELGGGLAAIRAFVAAGVVVAIGHTSADDALAATAFDAGATVLTHAFNAMPGIQHRAPGPVLAAVADPRVTLEVIADGVHVDPAVLRMLVALAPGRVALVTDAMAAAGASDGRYALGGLDVLVRGGIARLDDGTAEGGSIAGSTLTLDAALRTMVERAGMPLPDAVAALTGIPARALGRLDLGSLAVGVAADAVLLDPSLRVDAVWAAGARIR